LVAAVPKPSGLVVVSQVTVEPEGVQAACADGAKTDADANNAPAISSQR
jgi:hypothetical protein